MDSGDLRAQQISEIEQRLGSVEFASSSYVPTPRRYSNDYERAALLSSFGEAELDLTTDWGREVLKDCTVVVQSGEVRYVLDAEVRRRVLRQLGDREQMQQTLASVGDLPDDPVQVAINRIVDDEPVVDADASIGRLQTVYSALSWFADIIDTESPELVRARIEAVGLRDRFERLVGGNFSGRDEELQQLRDYVGVIGQGLIQRAVRRVTGFGEKPVLVITGPGGIGKSTLLAKFILDHASLISARQLPFAYLNFDSPVVRAANPKTLLIEALRQLAIEYPDFTVTINAQRDRWQSALLEESHQTDSAQLARDVQLAGVFRAEFVQLLSRIQLTGRPLLFVLDTFEIVQERQRGDIAALFQFLRDLQRDYPSLRVVISGRAGLDKGRSMLSAATDEIPTREMQLRGLSRETSADYLVNAGLSRDHAVRVANYLIPEEAIEDGASPLSLRVAAEISQRDLERADLDTGFWAQLRAGRIQAQLITRYVRHTDRDSVGGQLALPSLLLRRITADALASVVAPAWGVSLASADADRVFRELAGLISLVIERSGQALEPRQEVQGQIVDLLSDLEPGRVRRLHDRAVDYYAFASEDPNLSSDEQEAARFDEVLHRLVRGDDDETVRSRWRAGGANLLTGRMAILNSERQAVLDQLAGFQLTESMRAAVSRNLWEADAVIRAKRALEAQDAEAVVRIAAERDDWDRATDLSLLLAKAHIARKAPLDALDIATTALDTTAQGATTGLVADLYQICAEAAYLLDRPQDALDHVADALIIARERDDPPRIACALLLQAALEQARDERSAAAAVSELQAVFDRSVIALSESDALRLFGLVDRYRDLVPSAVRQNALTYLTMRNTRQLARVVTAVDEQVSAAAGFPPGQLALMAGLSVGESVTRTWQDILERGGPTATAGVVAALAQSVSARAELIDALAQQLTQVAVDSQPSEASTVAAIGLKLNPRRRRDIIHALLEESNIDELQAVVTDEFDRSLSSLTALDAADNFIVDGVVEMAERESWLGALIIAIRNRRPSAPRLFEVANEHDLSTIHFSASRLRGTAGARDLDSALRRLGRVEGQIGRLELGTEAIGTGLLVAPDVLLVAASSLDRDPGPEHGRQLGVRFGLKADAKGRRFDEGSLFPLATKELIDKIPYAHGPGFALLRVNGFPADEPLGSGRGQRAHLRRGFADISTSPEPVEGQNALICWQQAARLELYIARRGLTRAGEFVTVPSPGDTAEGAPCFGRSMDFLGLVLENRGGVAHLVPGVSLWESIHERGHGDTVGVALS